MTTYRTVVLKIPATPLGLLPERWTVEHWCGTCGARVATADLVAHAEIHDAGRKVPSGCDETQV